MNQYNFDKLIKNLSKPDILGKEKRKKFAILISLMKINNYYHFIFEKRAKNIRQGNEISFPGGAFDEIYDENLKDTAVRETTEELGINKNNIKIIKQFDTISSGIYIETYIGIININSIEDFNINKNEVDFVFTLPINFFLKNKPEKYFVKIRSVSNEIIDGKQMEYLPVEKLNLPKSYKNYWENYKREIYLFKSKYGTIWGITAEIIISLLKNR